MKKQTKAQAVKTFLQSNPQTKVSEVVRRLKTHSSLVYRIRKELSVPLANTHQEGGNHYTSMTIQPWDFIIDNELGFLEGNVIKYVCRWESKGGVEDLRKAAHYLGKLIETAEKKNVT